MTITALARELNVTTMTIYRRLKRAGVDLDQLRGPEGGELSPAGVDMIRGLFSASERPTEPTITDDGNVLSARLEAAQNTIKRLESERDNLIHQLDALFSALEREQADRQQERQTWTRHQD